MPSHAVIPSISTDDYLVAEQCALLRHEYVAGQIFAMAGASRAHNAITVNITTYLHAQLRGTSCRVFSSDMKVRVKKAKAFYYPDVVVSCEIGKDQDLYLEAPKLIVEVLSPSTESIGRREKRVAYASLNDLEEYLTVACDARRVEVYRRTSNGLWEIDTFENSETARLQSLGIELPLDLIYDSTEVGGVHPSMPLEL